MKSLYFFLAIFFINVAYSCSISDEGFFEDNTSSTTAAGRWELAKSLSGWSPEAIYYNKSNQKIFYEFYTDSTFLKYSTLGDTVRGIFSEEIFDGASGREAILVLLFKEGYLRNSCRVDREYFFFAGDTLVNDAWACDGPRMFYVKQ